MTGNVFTHITWCYSLTSALPVLRYRVKTYFYIFLFLIVSFGFLESTEYVFNDVLQPHQQMRIKVTLGMEQDLSGAGYHVGQSKIAIGSGGLTGKGI